MSGSSSDTVQGTSFAVMVPYDDTPAGAVYSDLIRTGAPDETDEVLLPVDPADPTGPTFSSDGAQSPFVAGSLSYSTGSIQMVAPNGFLRLGAPADYEWWLTNDPTGNAGPKKPAPVKLQPTGDMESPFGSTGVLLHSNQEISLFAPSINQTTNTRLNVTWSSPNRIGILSGQEQDIAGTMTNCEYQVADNFSSLIGNTVSTIGGSASTVWTGSDASTGFGSLLWSNFGLTQNLFGGQIVNITNGDVEVQGAGATKLCDFDVYAVDHVSLNVAPIAASAKTAASVAKALSVVGLLGMAVNAALTLAMEIDVGTMADKDGSDNDALRATLTDYRDQMYAITALTAATEVLSIAAGIALAAAGKMAKQEAASTIKMTNNSIVLTAGGTTVTIGTAGFRVDAGDPVTIALAQDKMILCDAEQVDYDTYAAQFLAAVQNPAFTGLMLDEFAQAVVNQAANGVVVPGVPTITLNSLTQIKAGAASVQFGLAL